MSLQQLLDIGLVPLEPGEFYRIRLDASLHQLQVRVARKRFGSRFIAKAFIWEDPKVWDDETQTTWHRKPLSPERSLYHASKRIQKDREERREWVSWGDGMRSFMGDHR